jgi:hypothetical protein
MALVLVVAITQTAGCYRGRPSEDPPIHLIQDMDQQPKYEPQERNPFFPDNRAMRLPIPGTVARGTLETDSGYFTGKDERGNLLTVIPEPITMPMLKRGQERYNIYCSPCHSRVGDGKGVMVKRGYIPPPTFHADRIRNVANGHIYDVIRNGIRNMPSYRAQIEIRDCWAITAYVRALQRSQNARLSDIPKEKRDELK